MRPSGRVSGVTKIPGRERGFGSGLRYTFVAVLAFAGAGLAPALAGAQALPTPESVLGFQPGADFELANYEQSVEYFRLLDHPGFCDFMRSPTKTSSTVPVGPLRFFSTISSARPFTSGSSLR